ncbi:MAG: hypothetical protein L3K15_07865, partial [Thermoplasmata archaeon]|nr:hypothetical protein [Thermoplasmata archaeon]
MPNESRNRRNVLAAFGTLLVVTALLALFAAPASSVTRIGPAPATASPQVSPATPPAATAIGHAAPRPAAVLGPIHGKYFVENNSLPSGTSNYALSSAVDTASQTVYSANAFGGTVTAYSESTGQVERSVTVGDIQFGRLPYAMVLDTNSNSLYVAIRAPPSAWVLQLNASTFVQLANISTSGAPSGVFEPFLQGAFDPASNQVFFTNGSDGMLLAINGANNHVTYVTCPAPTCSGAPLVAVPQLGELVATTAHQYLVIYNTSTDNPAATLTVPVLTASTAGAAYVPSSRTLVVGNSSSAPSTVFYEYNLSTRAYLGTLPHDPARVIAMVYDEAHNDVIATGTNGSRYIIAVHVGTGAIDGLYQESPTAQYFFSLSMDAPANAVVATGLYNNSSIAFRLPTLTPVLTYSSFPLEQVGIAFNAATGTMFTLGLQQTAIQATSESSGTVLWTDYQRIGTFAFSPDAMAVDPATNTLFVIIGGAGRVFAINGTNGAIETRMFLGPNVNGTALAVDSVAHLLYVAQDNQNVSVWSTTTHGLLGTVFIPGFQACGATASVTLHFAYFTNCISSGNVTTVDGLTFTRGTIFGAGITPQGIALDASGTLYVANADSHNITRINTATSTEGTPLSLGTYRPLQVVVDSSDSVLALTDIFATNLELVDSGTGILLAAPSLQTISFAGAYDGTSGIFAFP